MSQMKGKGVTEMIETIPSEESKSGVAEEKGS
jgi:hypothetical protein